ncbi:hypothetical protein SU69_01120 [Thermosipho melanesiensis]|uniref:Sporulation domain protein n=3 Tax=Thermosipho melanesiensis TaxID=46541 RepID=A6LJI2_THEM4|nr:hypothetical protein [Thermosipho melanesiensis]ABR30083.1 hypothetical protein Tmel_0209 [Thermosipho melanesiensis BI429]APT73280.1 hypothetical protein BW47_01160 [Thermosipho melanesiensis]OOC38673.1 hypothetical protein SU68_01120 [Thermosipho melanesiensis]OOC40477.1 hypothetical protein SU70_01120 [Thermosipho melanesiensis]OOC40742.1 hypothetical protein SU69_01120 [Thermosipho melanesiensis]
MRRDYNLRSFTPLELKIISTIILVLSLLTLLFLILTIYLYTKKSSVDVKIMYIPKPITIEISGSKTLPAFSFDSTSTMIKFETFDYEKLIANAIEILDYGTDVSTFVVDSKTALKIIKLNNNYLINSISDDIYFLVIPSNVELPGLLPGKSVYTIFLKTGENPEPIFKDIITLRASGYLSYAIKFGRKNKTFYSLCLGAFPDIDTAKSFLDNLKIKELNITTYGPYIGRITK